MREQFEKLPEISFRLGLVYFSESLNVYLSKVYGCEVDIGYINGSWYAFQEQQKKIDSIKAIAENWANTEYTYNSDSTDTKIEQMRICGREIIQELFK